MVTDDLTPRHQQLLRDMKEVAGIRNCCFFFFFFRFQVYSCERCGKRVIYKTVNTRMELLTSPGYPQDYENNEHCQWLLTTPDSAQMVQIESVATDIVNWDGGKCEDYIAVYDGLDNTKPLLRKWCGTEQAVVKSTGVAVLVVFHTDQHLNGKGFALKYYAMDKYSGTCDPDRVVELETSFNPLFLDLPSYTAPRTIRSGVVTCRYLLTATQDDASQVIRLETYTGIRCDEGRISVYDGPNAKSPQILNWCHETRPFEVITTSSRQTLVIVTLQRPNSDWQLMRISAKSRSKTTGCSDSNIPTIEITSEASYISFPYTTSVQGNRPCPLRLWAKGRTQTLRLELVNSTNKGIQCGDKGIAFYDDYPCNNDTERRKADNSAVETLPSLGNNITAYPNNAQCRYLLTAGREADVVEVSVQGEMTTSRTPLCGGDYITFYDGETSYATELGRWCGAQKRQKFTSTGSETGDESLGRWCGTEKPKFKSTGRNMLLIFTADDRWNTGGFALEFFIHTAESTIPAWGICLAVILPILLIAAIVIIIVFYFRHWRREQQKL
nr:hypothetical protein BaRGS_015747 [Batillaria attramentaria]